MNRENVTANTDSQSKPAPDSLSRQQIGRIAGFKHDFLTDGRDALEEAIVTLTQDLKDYQAADQDYINDDEFGKLPKQAAIAEVREILRLAYFERNTRISNPKRNR